MSRIRLTQSPRLFHHRLEHRLEVATGRVDDAQHFGGRGLLLQRLAQLTEQPRVLDGDDGLGGEVLTSAICLSVNGRTSWRKR